MKSANELSILLADDDQHLRNTLEEVLRRRGFHVWSAATGSEALDIARREPVDVGVFDLNMPDFTGMELLNRINSNRRISLPAILITSEVTEDVHRISIQIGVYRVVPKPLQIDPFTQALEELIGRFFA